MEPMSYQAHLDKLVAWASAEDRKQDLVSAKAEYFRLTGEVHEDDKSFEMRMASFLDWFLFDRVTPYNNRTPAQQYYDSVQATVPPEDAAIYRGFTETRHGLFEV